MALGLFIRGQIDLNTALESAGNHSFHSVASAGLMRSLHVQKVKGQMSAETFIHDAEPLVRAHNAPIQKTFIFPHCLSSWSDKVMKSVRASPRTCLCAVTV